jgi:hypothetical protein
MQAYTEFIENINVNDIILLHKEAKNEIKAKSQTKTGKI